MTKYAKIVNNQLEYAQRNRPGISNWINDAAKVLAAGYLPVDETNPQDGYYISGWKVSDSKIVPIFEKIPEPTIEEQNELIRQHRSIRMTAEADPLRYDYEEAVARGWENTEEFKQLWLAKKDQIRAELPYIEVETVEPSTDEEGEE